MIMDVRMPGMDGLEATKQLTERVPETAVLIFTAYSERSLLGRGLESGAKGYILKEAPHADARCARSRRSPAARASSTPR